ncbi:RNA polymerase factor sigma-54 [candidate division KSB1 bacterium]|nr:RNA polymerase factor sigma-54 [candidate division KSB1 bacterium]
MMNITQRLTQTLKQSPQQVLLSSLLQLPTLSLEHKIKMELETNPLLEEDTTLEEEFQIEQEAKIEKNEKESEGEAESDATNETDEIEWDEILNDEESFEYRIPKDNSAEVFERPEVYQSTLPEVLLNQLNMTQLTEREYMIGEYIIWNINEDGYLSTTVESIAENLSVDADEVEKVLNVIHYFEPVGIGARDLQECLLIQLKDKGSTNQTAIDILTDHFDDFKNKRYERIAKKTGIELKELKAVVEEIRKLNPKPGEGYINYNENYVVPDLVVEKVDGNYQVELYDWNIPHLRINNSYKKLLLDKKKTSKETKDYIKQRLESARWLINSIHQRRITIKRVMEAIVEKQIAFFEKGKGHIRPMILKDIADEIGMDISTVSRVTNGKYVQTDYGVFELKYFFSERIHGEDGDVSNKEIKDKIKNIIEKENPKKPLNDQKIAELLKKEGFRVARRTVAKYREQMKIPVSRLRRKI